MQPGNCNAAHELITSLSNVKYVVPDQILFLVLLVLLILIIVWVVGIGD